MNYKKFTLLFLTFIFSIFILTGCGYKPTSHYAKNEISGKVFVKLNVNIDNATNSVLVKDAVNEMVVNQFGASLTNNESKANTIMDVSLSSVGFTTLQSDSQGYAQLYRTNVEISLSYLNVDLNESKSLSVSGSYDYSVDADSVITDAKKQESVKVAAQKALTEIFSKIAVQSFKKDEEDKPSTEEEVKNTDDEEQPKSESYFFFK